MQYRTSHWFCSLLGWINEDIPRRYENLVQYHFSLAGWSYERTQWVQYGIYAVLGFTQFWTHWQCTQCWPDWVCKVSNWQHSIFFLCSRDNSLASPAVEFDFFTEFCDMLGVNDGLIKYDITKSGKLLSLLHEMLLSILNQDIYQVMNYFRPCVSQTTYSTQ